MKYIHSILIMCCWYAYGMIASQEKKPEEMEKFFNGNADEAWYIRCEVCRRLIKFQRSDIFANQQPNSKNRITVDRGAQLFKQGHRLKGWSIVCNHPSCMKNIEIEKK